MSLGGSSHRGQGKRLNVVLRMEVEDVLGGFLTDDRGGRLARGLSSER